MEKTKWSENVILVDADYVDAVAFNLIVNFERMLNRPIPKADLAQWLVCAALDGGVGEGKNDIQVVFIHGKGRKALDNFTPSDFEAELDGKAFCDGHLGEFKLSSVQVENLVDGDALYFIRKDEILNRIFAELRIISFDDELICTQMRDRRLTNPQSAYKSVRYFHFTLCGDGDAPVIIRKSEILMNPFAGLRINL